MPNTFTRYEAADAQQKQTLQKALKLIFGKANLSLVIRIEEHRGKLIIRDGTTPDSFPTPKQKEQSKKIIEALSGAGVITYKKIVLQKIEGRFPDTKILPYPVVEITGLNAQFFKPAAPKDPLGIPLARIWDAIPQEVQKNWERFSSDLRRHIIECVEANLERLFVQLADTVVLGETYRSPIGLEHPTIPVHIPMVFRGQHGQELMKPSEETYDLVEILRSKDSKGYLINPITRRKIALQEIYPAPEALEALTERAMNRAKGEFSPKPA